MYTLIYHCQHTTVSRTGFFLSTKPKRMSPLIQLRSSCSITNAAGQEQEIHFWRYTNTICNSSGQFCVRNFAPCLPWRLRDACINNAPLVIIHRRSAYQTLRQLWKHVMVKLTKTSWNLCLIPIAAPTLGQWRMISELKQCMMLCKSYQERIVFSYIWSVWNWQSLFSFNIEKLGGIMWLANKYRIIT